MAEQIKRPTGPYRTSSRLLYEHMAEHDYAVEFVGDPDKPIPSDLSYRPFFTKAA